jgi:hypothetical protein
MTKVSIEIEDIADKAACVRATRKLFTALADQHGPAAAFDIWLFHSWDPKADRLRAFLQTERDLDQALRSLTPKEQILILEYFDRRVTKRGLGKALAAKNGAKAASVTTQLRRAFRDHPEACRIISEAPQEWRRRAMSRLGRRAMTTRDIIAALGGLLGKRVTKPRA